MKRNACFSFLDLEAGHSGHDRDCDNTNVHESQASLVDFYVIGFVVYIIFKCGFLIKKQLQWQFTTAKNSLNLH